MRKWSAHAPEDTPMPMPCSAPSSTDLCTPRTRYGEDLWSCGDSRVGCEMGQTLSLCSALPLTSWKSWDVIYLLWAVSSSAKWESCASTTRSL